MNTIKAIGEHLRRRRKASKRSAVAVAEQAAVHPNTLRALELGKGNVELSRLLSILAALDLDLIIVPKDTTSARPTEGEGHLEVTRTRTAAINSAR